MKKSRTILSSSLLLLLLFQCVAAQSGNETSSDNPYGFNSRINPSMAIIIVVLIGAFFFMGFFSIYIRQCGESDRNASTRPNNGARGGRSRRVGLDKAVIQTFPILQYSEVKEKKIDKGPLECAVCLNEFDDDERLRLLPKCDHVFHQDCIDAWLNSHTTCPVCRANLVPGPESETPAAEATAAADMHDAEIAANGGSNRGEPEPVGHVAIDISDERDREPPQPEVIKATVSMQNRPARSRSSRRPMRFPRSHSTGHSLVQPGENVDRYTLRLPEHVRKEILQRTTSCVGFPSVGDGSSRGGRSFKSRGEGSGRGGRSNRGGGGEGSSRGRNFPFSRLEWATKSDRWIFSVTPPFFSRSLSVRSPKVADGAITPGKLNSPGSVKTPFDCWGKPETDEGGSARSSAPVFTVSSSQQP